ncbi:hypothetical protein Taro_014685 [Colocasia esculenta]|uniref:Uncharacterized protein n=1 Tax=Colocasia esculenta TaxID=4460 RepID=A0A843UK20_COLES|nr:hypothetical protein [Colocasia esculenta]
MCAVCRAWSGAADVRSGKATLEAVAIRLGRTELFQVLLDQGEELLRLFGVIWCFYGVLVALSTWGRCMERGRRRAVAGLSVLRRGREIPPFWLRG